MDMEPSFFLMARPIVLLDMAAEMAIKVRKKANTTNIYILQLSHMAL